MNTPEDLWDQLKIIAHALYGSTLKPNQAERIVRDVAHRLQLDPKPSRDAIEYFAHELQVMVETTSAQFL